jgi:hypothetical protein
MDQEGGDPEMACMCELVDGVQVSLVAKAILLERAEARLVERAHTRPPLAQAVSTFPPSLSNSGLQR